MCCCVYYVLRDGRHPFSATTSHLYKGLTRSALPPISVVCVSYQWMCLLLCMSNKCCIFVNSIHSKIYWSRKKCSPICHSRLGIIIEHHGKHIHTHPQPQPQHKYILFFSLFGNFVFVGCVCWFCPLINSYFQFYLFVPVTFSPLFFSAYVWCVSSALYLCESEEWWYCCRWSASFFNTYFSHTVYVQCILV